MSVKIADVDDYINPSQACINPLFTDQKTKKEKDEDGVLHTKRNTAVKPARRRRRKPLQLGIESDEGQSAVSGIASEPKRPTLSYALDDDLTSTEKTIESTSVNIQEKKPQKASLTVADCLACSGCITSAEAVLVTQHSVEALMKNCKEKSDVRIVFTISPATIADFCRILFKEENNGVKEVKEKTFNILCTYLKMKFNADAVLDGEVPQQISLIKSAMEFCDRYRYAEQLGKKKTSNTENEISLSTPSIALSATETRYLSRDDDSEMKGVEIKHKGGYDERLDFSTLSNSQVNKNQALPLLASSCPGFVCYVEKSVPEAVPNLCTVKSPMAIAGSIHKHEKDMNKLLQTYNIYRDTNHAQDVKIYHVCIMPCHDKKLEAGRKDLAWEAFNQQQEELIPDIDLVITTNELFGVLVDSALENQENEISNKMDFSEKVEVVQKYIASIELDECKDTEKKFSNEIVETLNTATMRGSGSYAEFIFRFACNELFGHVIPTHDALPWKKVGNASNRRRRQMKVGDDNTFSDSSEVELFQHIDGSYSFTRKSEEDNLKLKFATAYGFKNIQIMMSKVATGEMKMNGYHYIEAMACPSGCLNGGGQTHALDAKKRERPSEMKSRVEKTRNFIADFLPSATLQRFQADEAMHQHLRTRFHVVPKLELTMGAASGVAVENTHW